jgi:hypothetical protein
MAPRAVIAPATGCLMGIQMVDQWTSWKKFPEAKRGEHLDAPLGPGIYELRRATSGEMLGFGHTPNVAVTLSRHMTPSLWERMRGKMTLDLRDIEYRTMAATSRQSARDHAANIERRREAYFGRLAMR